MERRIIPLPCSVCETQVNHNGYNTYVKKGLGSVKIGRYECPSCKTPCEEDRSFWVNLKEKFFSSLTELYLLLRSHHLSFIDISDIMGRIFTRGKNTIYNAFNSSVERVGIPTVKNVRLVSSQLNS